jgi:hypothetical protein
MKDSDEILLIAKEESAVEAEASTSTVEGGFEETSLSVRDDVASLLERSTMETMGGFWLVFGCESKELNIEFKKFYIDNRYILYFML